MKNLFKKVLAATLALVMTVCAVPALANTARAADSVDMRILHLDCGRKYFTANWVKALIVEMKNAGYTHLELAIGNDGMRFLLDDMSVTVNGEDYDSAKVKAAVEAGNAAYSNEKETASTAWTQTEMDSIIAAAQANGIEIIPLINTPGHMDAILSAATSVTGTTCSYNGSGTTIDITDSTATGFTKAFLQKYIDYFAGKGCKYFNMGADEYANDIYIDGSMGFGNLVSTGNYGSFITYVNEVAAMVKAAGMTPMAFNDGFYFNGNTSSGTFSTDIAVCFWTSGWSGYKSASASELAAKGHKVINTNGDYYYVLGKTDQFSTHASDSYSYAANFSNSTFMGSTVTDSAGSMFCIWCDYPNAETETEIAANTRLLLRAMAARMQGYEISTISTDVVAGGFNADGTINTEAGGEDTVTIAIAGDTASFKAGSTLTLSLSNEASAAWTSSDDTVVSLASTTRSVEAKSVTATALKAGEVTITATNSDGTYTTALTVLADEGGATVDLPELPTAPTAGSVTTNQGSTQYVLDEDGVDSGEKYLIVAPSDAVAMYATSDSAVGAQSITISGKTATIDENEAAALWTINSGYTVKNESLNTYLIVGSSGDLCSTTSSNVNIGTNSSSAGQYSIYCSEGNWIKTYYYLCYNNGTFERNTRYLSSDYIRLYKQTEKPATYTVNTDELSRILESAALFEAVKSSYTNWEALGMDTLISDASKALTDTASTYSSESEATAQQDAVNTAAKNLYNGLKALETRKSYTVTVYAKVQGTEEELKGYVNVTAYEGENTFVAKDIFGDITGYAPVEDTQTVTVTGD
ncbi:MAG: family 20 glycosylhydrolase, partial [Candidatus Avispirillum sp.]